MLLGFRKRESRYFSAMLFLVCLALYVGFGVPTRLPKLKLYSPLCGSNLAMGTWGRYSKEWLMGGWFQLGGFQIATLPSRCVFPFLSFWGVLLFLGCEMPQHSENDSSNHSKVTTE